MHMQHINLAKKGHQFKIMQEYFGSTLCTFKTQYKSINTYHLTRDHAYNKTNNTRSSQVNMHINKIANIIKKALS